MGRPRISNSMARPMKASASPTPDPPCTTARIAMRVSPRGRATASPAIEVLEEDPADLLDGVRV